ncbi:MAG TPA: DegT/DnrJ/EryC1/StrS family aminotransferase [Elusimicrobiota bacterium]|nr:DegT/DnrJ/EryC1/StrS family aminotransferase [Elusimicrobiota bacterium]
MKRPSSRSRDGFIPMAAPVMGPQELRYVSDVIKSGWISSEGRYVSEFEKAFSRYCGVAHGVAVTSGTTALHLSLAVLGVGPGDEVLIPTLTHIAVPNAVKAVGAVPVPVDSEPFTWNLDPALLERKISRRTRAVIVVHLYGHPTDMDPVRRFARKHGLFVVEDAAESHGAQYKGRRTGSLGHLGCFSFYANKIIATGEGGMIVTDNARLARRARKLRDQAYEKKRRFWHREHGFNYRMTNLQAAVGLAQLERIEQFIAARRRISALYNRLLRGVPGLTPPPAAPWAASTHWMHALLVHKEFGLSRDRLMASLRRHGIDSRPFFYPVHLQPLYKKELGAHRCPVAESLSSIGMNLPTGSRMTEAEVRRIADTLLTLHRENSR